MLQLRGFVPTQNKVKFLDFHPVQPWIAFADVGDVVKVWDWSTQQTLHDLPMGGADDEGAVEAAINRTGERDGAFATNASAAGYTPSRVPSGRVRGVRFLDADVACWQSAAAHLAVNGTVGGPLPSAANVHALDGTRLLVVVCEAKVVLYDLATKKPFEVTKAALDGRSPTCVSFVFRGGGRAPGGGAAAAADGMLASPMLAVGCSDGAVRLVHLATLRPVARLVPGGASAKVGAITSIATVPSQLQRSEGYHQQQQQPHKRGGGIGGSSGSGAHPAAAAAAFSPARDLVIAGDAVGTLSVWDPFGQLDGGAGGARDITPSRAVSAHSGELWAMCLAPGPEDPAATSPRLFTCGADKTLAAWAPHELAELWRAKMEAKAPATSLAYSHRYFNLSGAHALLMTVNGSAVMALYTLAALPLERGLRPCADLAPLIPPGSKKVPKVYTVAASPMRPNLVAVGANSGLAFMTFDRMYTLPVAPLPPPSLAAAHVSPGRPPPPPGAAHVAYAAHIGDAVWLVACEAVERDYGDGRGPYAVPSIAARERIGDAAGMTGRAVVGASPSGAYVSVVWPAARRYVVYGRAAEALAGGGGSSSSGASAWREVDSGSGVDLAWHSHRDEFAVVDEPPPQLPLAAPRSKGLLVNREKEAARAAAAAAEAAAHAAAQAVVRIRALQGGAARVTCAQVAIGGGDVAVGVHGGPLLGIAYKRTTAAGADLSGEESSPVMQLWAWDGRTRHGPELPEPNFVAWDPTAHTLACGYPRQVALLRARPVFEPLASVPLAGATGAVWGLRQLYVATHSGVHAVFVAPGESRGPVGRSLLDLGDGAGGRGPAEPTVVVVPLAGTSGTDGTSGSAAAAGASGDATGGSSSSSSMIGGGTAAALPAPKPRPPGPITLLGAREGNLWLVNSYGQPMFVPMGHPGLRARCLAAMGDALGAAQVAAAGLSPRHHDDFACFLAALGGPDGARVALEALPGLSLETRIEFCIAAGQWRRAIACLEPLLRGGGAGDHQQAQAEPAAALVGGALAPAGSMQAGAAAAGTTAAAAAAAGGVVLGGALAAAGPQANDPPPPSKAAANAAMWGHMGFGGLFVDNFSAPTAAAAGAAGKRARDPVARGLVDWSAPLAAGWSFKGGRGSAAAAAAAATAGGGGGGAAAAAAAATAAAAVAGAIPPPASALRLAMRVVEGSHDAGVHDATAAGAALLLEHRGTLAPAQLARLAARMADIGMNADVRLLADAGAASGSHSGQAVGFVAAALTGDLARLQAALRASGTVSLAALQANAYRLPSSRATADAWNDALKAAAVAGGGQAHLTVMPPGL